MLHNLIIMLIINRYSYDTQYSWEIKEIMDGALVWKKNDYALQAKEKTID